MLFIEELTKDIYKGYMGRVKSDIELMNQKDNACIELIKKQHLRDTSFLVDILQKEY